jgi:2-dehydro-3-deoxyphosphooctonate aldolase (KDO 8-P synthase)
MNSALKPLPPMTLIAGPCVIEQDDRDVTLDHGLVFEVAQELKLQLGDLIKNGQIELYFKASFDKANRSSIEGFRGPGLKKGLEILGKVKSQTGLPLLTDFHTPDQARPVAEVVDFLQVPAFLCRQTDMIVAAASESLKLGRRLNVKKGQFLAPQDSKNIIDKVREVVNQQPSLKPLRPDWFCITERGVTHGYNQLVVDMSSFQIIQQLGAPVIYDATQSVQMPGAGSGGKSTGGRRELIETLTRSAIAGGADGLFIECHPRPESAKSDGPNAFRLEHVGKFVAQVLQIRQLVSGMPKYLV